MYTKLFLSCILCIESKIKKKEDDTMITVKVEPEVHNIIKKLSLDWGRSVQDTYDILLRNYLWDEVIPEPLEPKKEEPTVRVSREVNEAMKSIPKKGNMTNFYTEVMKEIINEIHG